jgi:hypothetical protein
MSLFLVKGDKPLLFAVIFLLCVPEYNDLWHPQYMSKDYSVP